MNFFNNPLNLLLIATAVLSGGMLLWPILQTRGRKLSHFQATQLINQGKTVIVDVREPAEFAAGHLAGAVNIPLKEFPSRQAEFDKFKSKNVITVCQSGIQSSRAASQLNKAGCPEVYSLEGGVAAWQKQGLPLVK